MNISEYLQRECGGAWVMNDYRFMYWDKQIGWIVQGNPIVAPRQIYYQGKSLAEALEKLK